MGISLSSKSPLIRKLCIVFPKPSHTQSLVFGFSRPLDPGTGDKNDLLSAQQEQIIFLELRVTIPKLCFHRKFHRKNSGNFFPSRFTFCLSFSVYLHNPLLSAYDFWLDVNTFLKEFIQLHCINTCLVVIHLSFIIKLINNKYTLYITHIFAYTRYYCA